MSWLADAARNPFVAALVITALILGFAEWLELWQ